MASVGPNSCGTGASDSGSGGTVAWSSPGNVTASDDTRATAFLATSRTSHYLKATNFGFSLASTDTIDGIIFEIEKSVSSATLTITDHRVRVVKADGTIGTTDKASGTAWSTTEAYSTYGSSSDKWGETWTYSDTNDVDFGVVISCSSAGSPPGSVTARIDHVRCTIYYTASGSSVQRSVSSVGVVAISPSSSGQNSYAWCGELKEAA